MKTYIKVSTPGGKRYHALLQGQQSQRSFRTATQAEEYARAWKERYHILLAYNKKRATAQKEEML